MTASKAPQKTNREILPLDKLMNLIHQQANKCLIKLPRPLRMEYDDLVEEGILCYYKTITKYDPKRGTFITLFHLALRHNYGHILEKSYRHHRREMVVSGLGEHDEGPEVMPPGPTRIDDLCYRRLSKQAWLIARILVDSPRRPKLADLFRQAGVGWWEGRRAMWEIAHAVNPRI